MLDSSYSRYSNRKDADFLGGFCFVYCGLYYRCPLKISNGKWYWFSRGIGGISALDYLIHVKGINLPAAVRMVNGRGDDLRHVLSR